MQFSQHTAIKINDTWIWAIHGTDVKNMHINRNNITLTDLNGNVLDVKHVNCKTIN